MQNLIENTENSCNDGAICATSSQNENIKSETQMSVALLDMLAEVASNSLQHEYDIAEPAKSQLTTSKGARIATNRLLGLFSKFDGDEMRRRFTFTCLFDEGRCEMTFSSFGSELKARQCMKSHLFDHVQQAGGSSQSAFYKQRKLQTNKKSVTKKGSKGYLEYSNSSSIPNHKLNKNSYCLPSSSKVKTSITKSTPKIQRDFKQFCGKAKCDKTNRNLTQPFVYVPHEEHNYTTQKASTAPSSSELRSNSHYELHDVDVVTDEYKDDTSSLNSFMLHEANYLNSFMSSYEESSTTKKKMKSLSQLEVLATCFEKNDSHSQMTKLPPVGEEVSVETTGVPDLTKYEGTSSRRKSGLPSRDAAPSNRRTGNTSKRGGATTEKDNLKLPVGTERDKTAAQKLTDKEMAIKLIAEAKFKGSAQELFCTICSPHRQFTALTTLMSHYRSHAGIKPFECQVCHRSFTRQHSLKYHLLIHQNATRFTCTHCARKFRHPAHFREHLRKHTGEEPFHCCDCSARFKTRNTFKRHLRSRHNKVLMPSGEVFQLKETDETSQPSHERSQATLKRQETSASEVLDEKRQGIDKENALDWGAEAEAFFDVNDGGSMLCPFELVIGVEKDEINKDLVSIGYTRDEVSSDGNNNATTY